MLHDAAGGWLGFESMDRNCATETRLVISVGAEVVWTCWWEQMDAAESGEMGLG